MVSVLIKSGSSIASCGGSLINDRYIMTAAHCMKKMKNIENLFVTIGAHTISNRRTLVPLIIEKVISHPGWREYESNDIALIKLKTPIANVTPICLPSFTKYDNLFVTGWGMTGKTGNKHLSKAQELMEVNVKEVNVMTCKEEYFPLVNPEREICAGGDKGGSCMGDSGGPLQTRKNGRVYQVGIVSFGTTDCSTISKEPNVYERVTGQLRWIKENTKDAEYCDAPEQAIKTKRTTNKSKPTKIKLESESEEDSLQIPIPTHPFKMAPKDYPTEIPREDDPFKNSEGFSLPSESESGTFIKRPKSQKLQTSNSSRSQQTDDSNSFTRTGSIQSSSRANPIPSSETTSLIPSSLSRTKPISSSGTSSNPSSSRATSIMDSPSRINSIPPYSRSGSILPSSSKISSISSGSRIGSIPSYLRRTNSVSFPMRISSSLKYYPSFSKKIFFEEKK